MTSKTTGITLQGSQRFLSLVSERVLFIKNAFQLELEKNSKQ